QNPPSTPEGDLISFDENPPTLQPREASAPAVDPGIGSSSKQNIVNYQDKTILIHKNIANGFEFYDGKRKWYGVKEDFCALSNKYYFIKSDLKETTIEAYKRIIKESETIAEKTNGQVDMRKSGSYTLTSLKLFKETTLVSKRSEKVNEKENAWLNLASTGALVFAERYEGEAIQYDVNSMYVYEMLKKEASWPFAQGKFHTINSTFAEKWGKFPYGIYKATIEGNPPKKSLQCTRYLRYNPYGIYTHYDLECAKKNGLKVYLMNESPNALIYEKNTRISGRDMFGKWGNILYNIKKEGGIAGKVSKALLVSLWGVLCEQRNGQNYGTHPRIKPFLLASARKRISEIVKPLGDQVKRIHTDGFIVAGKVELKTGIEMEYYSANARYLSDEAIQEIKESMGKVPDAVNVMAKTQFDQIHNANTSARRREESRRSRTPPPSYEEVSSMLDRREVSASHRGRSMSPSGRSNNSRSHSNVNQGNGGAGTAETNRQNPETRAPTSTENNPDNEINATGNSDSMSVAD
ncbi:5653_t:CDS:2, partial [Entrophospora sp. SA101]